MQDRVFKDQHSGGREPQALTNRVMEGLSALHALYVVQEKILLS